jgi:hypothetical protein
MTRYDARLSAVRAFSFGEMRNLALRGGWKHFGHKKFRFARQAIRLETSTIHAMPVLNEDKTIKSDATTHRPHFV